MSPDEAGAAAISAASRQSDTLNAETTEWAETTERAATAERAETAERAAQGRGAEPTAEPAVTTGTGPSSDGAAAGQEAADGAPRDETLIIRGRRVAVRRFGAQDAPRQALAAHGWAGHGGRWASLAEIFGGALAVTALDLPGCGRSDPPPEDGNPIYAHDAAALAELAEAASAPLHLIGAGPGAEAAARTALRRPDKTASLALIEPAAFALLEEAEDPRRMEALDLALGVTALASLGEKAAAARMTAEFWSGEGAFDALDPEERAYATACADRAAAEMKALSRHTPGALLFEDYQAIEAPMLVISGRQAPASLRASAARIRRAAPAARAVELKEARAAAAPAAVDAALRAFLETLGRPAA